MSARAVALSVSILASTVLPAQADLADALPSAALREAYLACERAAVSDRMETGGIMACSTIYEDLKQREFGGDFGRLRAWSDPLLGRPDAGDAEPGAALLF